MSRFDKPLSCARTLVLLEPYLDGDLLEARRQRVETHLHDCVDCRAAVARSRQIQMTLRDLPALQAPTAVRQKLAIALPRAPRGAMVKTPHWQDRLAAAVSRTWEAVTGQSTAQGSDYRSGGASWLRPAAAAVVLVLLVVLWAQQRQPATPVDMAQVSEQELLDAQYQTRWALAYLARVTASAGDTAFIQVGNVMSNVIGEHVMGSVTNAVGRSMQPSPEPEQPGTVQEEVQAP
jgi:anti-sigma factor RsiW